jgi:hypothetical protein
MESPGPAAALSLSHPSAALHFSTAIPIVLPPYLEVAIAATSLMLAGCHKSPSPELSISAARPRVELTDVPLLRAESVAVRYPTVDSLHPEEELLKHVRIAPPAGLATLAGPEPAECAPAPVAAAAVPASWPERGQSAGPAAHLNAPAEMPAQGVDRANDPIELRGAWLPVEVQHRLTAHVPAPIDHAPRPIGRQTATPDFEVISEATLAPFVTAPAPCPVESLPTAPPAVPVALDWPPVALRQPTLDAGMGPRRAAVLASSVAAPPPVPVESLPAIPAFEPVVVPCPPLALSLPGLVHRSLWAAPQGAPARRVLQFPHATNGSSRSASCAMTAPALCLPKYTPGGTAGDVETIALTPRPVSFLPSIASHAPSPIETPPPTALPQFAPEQRVELAAAGFEGNYPPAAEPVPDEPDPGIAVLEPIATLPANPAAIEAECTSSAVPEPGFIPIDYYCQRASGSPRYPDRWIWPVVAYLPPSLTLPLAADKDDPVERPMEPEPSTVAEIFSHPEAKSIARRRLMGRLAQIAACLLLVVFVWFGSRALTNSGQSISQPMASNRLAEAPRETVAAAKAPGPAPAEQAPQGFFGRVQHAIAGRATVELNDNLHAGMTSWGTGVNGWASGWSRNNIAGYVHPGELALYRPSLKFTDYRLEFFGLIENRAMGWVVRGQDKQNYYAMKFQVVQSGLRPVIAMVHYPVVDGKRGHKIETPLNIMVHQNEPFHVSVEVSGNRFTASLEGQKIESWTDDTPAMGGVGFFSDASERARLYWMRVTKNDDWLGTICSLLAGNDSRQTAQLREPGLPTEPSRPGTPAPQPDVILAESENNQGDFGERHFAGRQNAKTLNYRRNRVWNS